MDTDYKQEIIKLLDKISDQKVIRRVWKILIASLTTKAG